MNQQETEKQITAIAGNEPVLEALYKLLDDREALAFVGAGASAGLWPLWDEFLKGLVDYSRKLGKITEPEAKFFKKEAGQNPLETAQQLRNRILDRYYLEYLRETFQDKISEHTGGAFTATQRALLQLPIHNYITLNYDAGLTNAREALYPRAATSYFFWDQEEARQIRERGHKRLVLHAHGRHDRADSIILTLDDYRRAYDHPPFVRLLNELFHSEKLLFIGFGMNDPYIKQLFNNVSKDSSSSPFRHIAFVGLEQGEMAAAYLLWERVEMVYGARVLFYPAADNHRALSDWLTMLTEKYRAAPGSREAEEIRPLPASPALKAALPDRYLHRPTDDENFSGRAQDFAILNRWASDPATRAIAITGIGGQGKTALTGRWLKRERAENLAGLPVFYWSFYEDLDMQKFLAQAVEFCLPIVRVYGTGEIEPVSFILRVAQEARLLLALDGLEVLQEDAVSPAHGNIHHPLLYPFLQNWLRLPHKSLLILTSRFRFPQLERYRGVSFQQLELRRLSPEDGAALLRKLNIFGDDNLLESYVEKLSGHPLALRVLASAVKRACFGDLAQFRAETLLAEGDPLGDKLQRLLRFYEKQLKGGQKELMAILSLFKRPVESESFVTLLGKMKSLEKTPLAKADKTAIENQLNLLIEDFLVEKTAEGVTTHPVIRDYFRSANPIAGAGAEVADFLKTRPGAERPASIAEVRDLVEAVQLLCDEGELRAAFDLYISRLHESGYGFDIFKSLPAITEGLVCSLAFVSDKERQHKVEKILGKGILAAYCSFAALYNSFLGNLPQAIEWRYKALELRRQEKNKNQQALELQEISLIEMTMGTIQKAKKTVAQALKLPMKTKKLEDLMAEFSYKALYEFLSGYSSQAYRHFEIALLYEQKRNTEEPHLYALQGNHQTEFFLRIQVWKQFETLNSWNIKSCTEYHWNNNLAICRLLQGWYEIRRGELAQAEKELAQAEAILRPSGMLEYICRLDWAWGLLAEAKGDTQTGLRHVNEALFTAADKGFRLRQAELFALRGRLLLLQFQKEGSQPCKGSEPLQGLDLPEKAGDDGSQALKIAEETGYAWAKLEALQLLASCCQTRAQLPEYDRERETEAAQRYAREAEALEKGLLLSEKQMKELKAQAKKEFEQQTAGWE